MGKYAGVIFAILSTVICIITDLIISPSIFHVCVGLTGGLAIALTIVEVDKLKK